MLCFVRVQDLDEQWGEVGSRGFVYILREAKTVVSAC